MDTKSSVQNCTFDYAEQKVRIEYAQLQNAETPLVILIHGVGGSMEMFQEFTFPVLQYVRGRFIAINLPGYGESSVLNVKHTMANYREVLLGFLDTMGITRCHLVGISHGGALVLSFAATYPKRVISVTAQEAIYKGKEQFFWPTRLLLGALGISTPLLLSPIDKVCSYFRGLPVVNYFMGRILNPVDLKLLRAAGDYGGVVQANARKSSMRAFCENLEDVSLVNITLELEGISVPTLITEGENTVSKSVRSSDKISRILPASVRHTAVIPNSGHLSPHTNPQAFVATLMDFIIKHLN